MNKRKNTAFRFLTGHILLCATIALHIGMVLLSTRISFFPGADVLRTIVTTCAQTTAPP